MIRGVGLRSAVAINVATMIGAGPLITIPLVVTALHGSISVLAWIAGAAIALCDGLVYAELASRFPRSGGTYAYLREAFGAHGGGRLVAFLFVWQFLFFAPLTLATGYIGFAQYAAYLSPALGTPLVQHAVALGVGAVTLVSLYRTIPRIAHTALALGAIALLTLIAVAASGFAHPAHNVLALLPQTLGTKGFGIAAFGAALVITLYDYAGYNDVCLIGDEVIAPTRTIPLAVVISIVLVAIVYIALNLGVFSALSIREVADSTFVASLAVERTSGHLAAVVVTVGILITAFASTYGLLLGSSRIPYAAARDGDFLPSFARLHSTKRFPHVSLLAIGLLALPASLFPLDAVINALTAGIVLVQGAGGCVALLLLRARGAPAPFRAPLYPLPALVALAAWLFLFWSSGTVAMAFGVATLACGGAIFLVRARLARAWPFAAVALAGVLLGVRPAAAADFTHAQIVQQAGTPVLAVDGKPFFFFGGAFFYERIPPEDWRASLLAMRALGANTLDLYVPWNWHEVADGRFDFDGHTNPRRNLRLVLRLARELRFHLIVRPGPVIRNEWRNGGYPAWLLTRPDYGMPLHDVLEGRYPATATLQNAHSDDAAAQWLRNPTHRRYAARWLHAVLHEFIPYADLVLAVQLDDDQGAYIDNQTWPAPHLAAYLHWLERNVRAVVGPTLPAFINTYDMKVPASAPVWAMGNWYQSDAYRIGDHDRVELDFATATLTTQERVPLAQSEFQAGWLASPEDPQPRSADPTNTTLALAELLSWGAHGIVDFPLQDTLAPFGWEAPFSNAFYTWDAALPRDLRFRGLNAGRPSRLPPTQHFGDEVAAYGPLLAAAHRVATIAIAYEVSASDPGATTNDDVAAIAAQTKTALRACNDRGLTCDLVDLRFSSDARLRRYRTLVVAPFVRPPLPFVRRRLAALRAAGVAVVAQVPAARGSGITVLAGPSAAFGIAVNWSDAPRRFGGRVSLGDRSVEVPAFTVAPRDARLVVLEGQAAVARPAPTPQPGPAPADAAPLNATQRVALRDLVAVAAGTARVERGEVFGSGDETVTLVNHLVRAVFVPGGGARLVVFGGNGTNATNATGALRDDVLVQPPSSTTDRIARYTHSYPAGTFNRPYRTEVLASGSTAAIVRFTYEAPDLGPGARFQKTVRLDADSARLVVDERIRFADGAPAMQRGVSRWALAVPPEARITLDPERGFSAASGGTVISVAWAPAGVDRATWTRYGSNGTLTLVAAARTTRTTFAVGSARTPGDAAALARAERDWVAANPNDSAR